MYQLINVQQNVIGNDVVNSCIGRDLHNFLEVQTPYDKWFPRRVEEYGFIEGQDFSTELSKSTGGRPSVDHFISIDMAKELSMVEKTAKGKLARQYFIACEKALHRVSSEQLSKLEHRVRRLETSQNSSDKHHIEKLREIISEQLIRFKSEKPVNPHSNINSSVIIWNGRVLFKGKVIMQLYPFVSRGRLNTLLSRMGFELPLKATSVKNKLFKVFKCPLNNFTS